MFSKNKLLYEGEYLNGKRNGKGKKYNSYGKIEFEGEYFNDKMWNGVIKEYSYKDDFLVYEGKYINGEKNGKGKEYEIKNGKGKEYFSNSEIYQLKEKKYH